jgi:hypothetical protein
MEAGLWRVPLSAELERREDPLGLGWCLANFNISETFST